MGTVKLKQKLHEIETQNSDDSVYCAADPTDSSSKQRRKKRNIMQLESKEKGGSRKLKTPKLKNGKASDHSKKSGRSARKRARYTDIYDDVEAKYSVMERAYRVLACLENELPHFLKCMLPSNVAHGFWLHLPKTFCNIHLPNHDTSIMLVDEWGNEYRTSYLLDRHGLSAGWRGFSISHRLLKGDILIFHLTAPCKLKVRIVRVNDPDVVTAALSLVHINAYWRGNDGDKDERKRRKTKYVEPFLLASASPVENVKGKNAPNSNLDTVADHSSDDNSSDMIEKGTNQHQTNDICYPETSFLRDHSHEGVTTPKVQFHRFLSQGMCR